MAPGAIVRYDRLVAKHKHPPIQVEFPEWVHAEREKKVPNACLVSVAEDAYYALALAEFEGAAKQEACAELLTAGKKSLRTLGNARASTSLRCKEGDRAARKFWEAKVCARR